MIDQVQKADANEASRLAKDSGMGVMLDGFSRDGSRGFPGCRTLSVTPGTPWESKTVVHPSSRVLEMGNDDAGCSELNSVPPEFMLNPEPPV